MMFLRPRLRSREEIPVIPVELSPVERARQEFDAAAKRVAEKHAEIKQKEEFFKDLLASAPQDKLVFDALQLDLSRKKAVLQNLGGL